MHVPVREREKKGKEEEEEFSGVKEPIEVKKKWRILIWQSMLSLIDAINQVLFKLDYLPIFQWEWEHYEIFL